jgi:hypothetical protein
LGERPGKNLAHTAFLSRDHARVKRQAARA